MSDPSYTKYRTEVREKIVMNWIPGNECSNDKIRVHAIIDQNGNVTKAELVDKSLNGKCAQLALNAVTKSSPLPVPPGKLESEAFDEGFIIDFQK